MIKKHKSLITFSSWYQCDRLDEISSGMEDLVKYGETISKGVDAVSKGVDAVSSGIEDLAKYSETISKGEEFNIYKALGYELLGSNATEGEAYLAGKRRHEEILKQKEEEEKRQAEREREQQLKLYEQQQEQQRKHWELQCELSELSEKCWEPVKQETIYNPWMGERKKSKPENNRSLILVCFLCLLLPAAVVLFYIFDNASEICNLICNNIFLIALFLIPTVIIYVGYKIETKK